MILFLHPRGDYELHGCRRFKRSDKRAETRIALYRMVARYIKLKL